MSSPTIERIESVPCVRLGARLDTMSSQELDKVIDPVLLTENYLVIDFSGCNYMSSSGIRSLVTISKKIGAGKEGMLVLAGVQSSVCYVLEMAGLHQLFNMEDTVDLAIQKIRHEKESALPSTTLKIGQWILDHQQGPESPQAARIWKDQGIVGYDELEISVGQGVPAESDHPDHQNDGLFVTLGNTAGFIPDDPSIPPDFRFSMDPAQSGIFVRKAVSLSNTPCSTLHLQGDDRISVDELKRVLTEAAAQIYDDGVFYAAVIADRNPAKPSVSVVFMTVPGRSADPDDLLPAMANKGKDQNNGVAISFALNAMEDVPWTGSLQLFLQKTMTLDNILEVLPPDKGQMMTRPVVWLLIATGTADAAKNRLQIEAGRDFLEAPHKSFLTRRLYKDSSRLELKTLQGGFSAQTFQVTSYDHQGRKLRPTVLKIADRNMIAREATHCREYAMPYILNNSAMVLGTAFFGDTGSLRYNFVGIGGESSKLKWLTHYYTEWPSDQLIPLFDKIFLHILKPWYGQAAAGTIHPFRDHDPRRTFFPHIEQSAAELLGISSDEPHITIEGFNRQVMNPFWFLKNKYPEKEHLALDYYTSICHGDLNMQNILLDEQMNVYLIDFSETRPRSVVSDFARLESVFLVEFSKVEDPGDFAEVAGLINRFYETDSLSDAPVITSNHDESVMRNFHMSQQMRAYALKSSNGNPDPVPYTIALLEWLFPVVCYRQASVAQKRLSVVISGLLCERLSKWL